MHACVRACFALARACVRACALACACETTPRVPPVYTHTQYRCMRISTYTIQVACETTPRVPPVPKEDRVVFHVSDMHNTGCTNQSGAARGPARLESWVEVRNVDDAPTVVLLKAGADVCGVCARTQAGIR